MVIAGIIGIALTRLVVNQARFVSMQDAMMRARGAARASLNVLNDELRMVSGGGVIAATKDSITVRVPYAFGIACIKALGFTTTSLFPTDSASFALAVPSGYAWRDNNGRYVFEDGAVIYSTGVPTSACSVIGISTLSVPGWTARVVAMTQDLATDTTAAIYLYQNIRYAFAPSVEMPGRRALWRTVLSTGVREEMVAPFDTSAKFQFLVGTRYTMQAAPPTPLDSLRGVRMRLVAASEQVPQGRSVPATFDMSVNVYFRNYAP